MNQWSDGLHGPPVDGGGRNGSWPLFSPTFLVKACLRAPPMVADEAKLANVFTYFFFLTTSGGSRKRNFWYTTLFCNTKYIYGRILVVLLLFRAGVRSQLPE